MNYVILLFYFSTLTKLWRKSTRYQPYGSNPTLIYNRSANRNYPERVTEQGFVAAPEGSHGHLRPAMQGKAGRLSLRPPAGMRHQGEDTVSSDYLAKFFAIHAACGLSGAWLRDKRRKAIAG
jgi:hypothetical protein